MIKRFLQIVALLLIVTFSTLSFTSFAANRSIAVSGATLKVYALDTIAGYSTVLKTSQITPNSKVVFDVFKPSGEKVQLTAAANQNGVAQAELSDYYTRAAGNYRVGVRLDSQVDSVNFDNFLVFPGDLSVKNSLVSPADQVVRSSSESALVKVKLVDDFNNPIQGHLIKLVSSSVSDRIETVSNSETTDANGEVSFKIFSDKSGASTYVAYDVTADKILDSRARVAFFTSNESIFALNSPSNFAFAASGNGSSAADHLEFENLPSSINVGSSVTFTLTAKDVLDQNVTDYTGRVRFSILSDNFSNANLPGDYTFTTSDIGSHTFSLSLSFTQPGSYTLEARDLDTPSISGTQIFTVNAVSSPSSNGSLNSSGITITNPVPGTYSNNIQVISGTSSSGAQLKIYDNNVEVGSVIAGVNGAFSFTTSFLADGLHSFYVARVNDIGTIVSTSPSVSISIDTSAPDLGEIVIEPNGPVAPGSLVTVQIYPQEDLSSAALIFENGVYDLTDSGQGFFTGSFTAPLTDGSYPMDFLLVDQLGNESQVNAVGSLTVGTGTSVASGNLGDVTGLVATPADHRVTLNWGAPDLAPGGISNYRVFYGLSPNQLTEAVDTFTNSTTWYIPNLKNGTEYYFAVVAVDENGGISEHFSNIVASTPNPLVAEVQDPDVTAGIAGGEALSEMESDVSETGPEIIWLLTFAILAGFGYSLTSKRIV